MPFKQVSIEKVCVLVTTFSKLGSTSSASRIRSGVEILSSPKTYF